MSGWLVGLIVVAVGFTGLGLQVLSLQLNRFPADGRHPGPLIEIRRRRPGVVHAAELRRLSTVISYASINDRVAKVELQKIFDALDGPTSPILETSSSRRDHRRRTRQIERAVADLERHWGLTDAADGSGPGSPTRALLPRE
jgi:hypothetical protein